MFFHSFPPCSFCVLIFCVPPFSYHLHTYHGYRSQLAVLDRQTPHVGHSVRSPLPSPLASDILHCIRVFSVQHNLRRILATGLPFMSIPLSLFLTFHCISHIHYSRIFPTKHPGQQNLTLQFFLCYVFCLTLSPC